MPPGQCSSEGWTLLAPRGIISRVAMCVGKCSRIVGPCLLVLGMLSLAANILLLFPGGTSKYLVEGHISKQAKAMPGVWGGGITVLLAATHITAVGWRCAGCSDCGTRRNVRQHRDPCAKAVPSSPWWDVVGGLRVGCGGMPPLPWSCGGTQHRSSSPMAPGWDVAGCPLLHGGSWKGASSPLAPWWDVAWRHLPRGGMGCWHGLCLTNLCMAAPCLSLLPACPHSLPASVWLKTAQ
ncbi:transmembrane 4 L6 family member 19 isoform 2-T2 [Morphnus guianensis]